MTPTPELCASLNSPGPDRGLGPVGEQLYSFLRFFTKFTEMQLLTILFIKCDTYTYYGVTSHIASIESMFFFSRFFTVLDMSQVFTV